MGFKCGIVGLPNVGKSTLFNALTKTAAAQAANYPFCTIEPNTGEVAVPDPRMRKLADIAKSKELIPTRISFVDIAGLVRGASKGEGLGMAKVRRTTVAGQGQGMVLYHAATGGQQVGVVVQPPVQPRGAGGGAERHQETSLKLRV